MIISLALQTFGICYPFCLPLCEMYLRLTSEVRFGLQNELFSQRLMAKVFEVFFAEFHVY
jgi:hypothetical protein